MAGCGAEVKSCPFSHLIGWNAQKECLYIYLYIYVCVCVCVCVAGHSNDPRCDSLSGPTHSSWEKGGWAVGRTVHGSANRKKKERKKERGRVRGFLIQSALSASGSKSHTTSIFHTRRSQGAGAAGVCVICWVLCLHRVCMCMCVCFFCVWECVCVSVCVWGGYYLWENYTALSSG